MITVDLQLKSAVSASRDSVLGRIEIFNLGSDKMPTRSDYGYAIYGKKGRHMKSGVIYDYPREKMHPWNLVGQCLADAGYVL